MSRAAKFARAPGTQGGKKRPTIFCPVQIGLSRRARKTVRMRAEPKFPFRDWVSAIAKRKGYNLAARMKPRWSGCIRAQIVSFPFRDGRHPVAKGEFRLRPHT